MKRSLQGEDVPKAMRKAVAEVLDWVADETVPRPPRESVAQAVRLTLQLLAAVAPGHNVEVRVPPWGAVQCISGSVHRRGTPPNVVECDPRTWLRLVVGFDDFSDATLDSSGAHAAEVGEYLPLLWFPTA